MKTSFHYFEDAVTGIQAVLCYHGDPSLPAIGGCRLYPYVSFDDAKADAQRLAIAMDHKARVHGLLLSGAKLVCMVDPSALVSGERPGFFKRLGDFVQQQGGRYIAAMDSGVTLEDMDHMSESTDYISNNSALGEPSAATAYGVYTSIERINAQYLKQPLSELSLAIMGVGAVGSILAKHFAGKVAHLYLSDCRRAEIEPILRPLPKVSWLPSDELLTQPCDILAPCALGQMIDAQVLAQLNCKVIAGAANNPLADNVLPADLHARGIAYVPDYVINGGGLIACAAAYFRRDDWLAYVDHVAEKTDDYCCSPA